MKRLVVTLLAALLPLTAACAGGSGSDQTAQSGKVANEAPEGDSTTTTAARQARTFTRADWAELDTNPDDFEGDNVDIVGQILGEPERDADGVYFQMFADPKNSEWSVLVGIPGNVDVTADDYVHVLGEVVGSYEGKNAFGGTIGAVTVRATKVQKVDALAAASPAIRAAKPNASQTQHGLTVTVNEVQYAADETRVLVTVKNGSGLKASFYDSSAKAVQGTQQFDTDYSLMDYPEIPSEILPGVSASGVIVFPTMNPAAPTQLVLDGRTDDYSLDFTDFVFNIAAG